MRNGLLLVCMWMAFAIMPNSAYSAGPYTFGVTEGAETSPDAALPADVAGRSSCYFAGLAIYDNSINKNPTMCTETRGGEELGLMSSIICVIRATMAQAMFSIYCNLIEAVDGVLTSLLVLYVILYGIMLIFGLDEKGGKDVVIRYGKITIIYLLATNPTLFTVYVYNFFYGALEGISYYIFQAYPIIAETTTDNAGVYGNEELTKTAAEAFYTQWGGELGIFAYMDKIMGLFVDTDEMFGLVQLGLLLLFSGPGGIMAGVLLIMSAIVVIFAFFNLIAAYITAIVGITFLLMLSPIFIAMVLFKRTQRIFNGWIGTLVSLTLQPSLLLLFVVIAAALLQTAFQFDDKGIFDVVNEGSIGGDGCLGQMDYARNNITELAGANDSKVREYLAGQCNSKRVKKPDYVDDDDPQGFCACFNYKLFAHGCQYEVTIGTIQFLSEGTKIRDGTTNECYTAEDDADASIISYLNQTSLPLVVMFIIVSGIISSFMKTLPGVAQRLAVFQEHYTAPKLGEQFSNAEMALGKKMSDRDLYLSSVRGSGGIARPLPIAGTPYDAIGMVTRASGGNKPGEGARNTLSNILNRGNKSTSGSAPTGNTSPRSSGPSPSAQAKTPKKPK